MRLLGFLFPLIIIFLLFSQVGCQNKHSVSNRKKSNVKSAQRLNMVTLTVDTEYVKGKSRIGFYFHDSLAYGHPVYLARDKNSIAINSAALFFTNRQLQIPHFVYPGENIRIKYADTDTAKLYISGKRKRSNELNFFRALVLKTGNIYYTLDYRPFHRKTSSLSNVLKSGKMIDKLKKERIAFLSDYVEKNPVSNYFRQMADASIRATAIRDSVLLYFGNRDLIPKSIARRFALEKVKSLSAIRFTPVQLYYIACISLSDYYKIEVNSGKIKSNTERIKQTVDFANQFFKGETKDFIIANAINNEINSSSGLIKNFMYQLEEIISNKAYAKLVKQNWDESSRVIGLKGKNQLLTTDGKTTIDLQTLINNQKGKLILLDFWASWCAPCREEMPLLSKIESQFSGKNIAFIRISKDDKIKDWKAASIEEALNPGKSFLFLQSDKSPFIKSNKINLIPRYILLGKNGEMLSINAPRPSDPALVSLIKKHLL